MPTGDIYLPADHPTYGGPQPQRKQVQAPPQTNAFGQQLPIPDEQDYLGRAIEVMKGLAGFGSGEQTPDNPHWRANRFGQLLGAIPQGKALLSGLPWVASEVPWGKVFRGDKEPIQGFWDQGRNTKSDILGSYLHFAEDPNYADKFAMTEHFQPNYYEHWGLDPQTAPYRGITPSMMGAQLHVKNALDLRPNTPLDEGDLQQFLSVLRPEHANSITETLKGYKRGDPEAAMVVKRQIENILRRNPDLLEKAGFDGVRYHDAGNPAWAVPNPHQAEVLGQRLGPNEPSRFAFPSYESEGSERPWNPLADKP